MTDDPSTVGLRVDVDNLTYGIYVEGERREKLFKRLITKVSFHVESGELCALMGSSGAGKSTLLDMVANRKLSGMWSGNVLVNNEPRNRWYERDISYVLQDDFHIPTLTVEETIYFSACTRMPEGSTTVAITERVRFLLDIMSLIEVRNSFVGDSLHKGISGGQMKRLSIAVEIVALPYLIFLDEPTSGLDSAIALEVMKSVRSLVDLNRTSIATIHQPSPQIFALFDKVVLLSAGRLVYFGPSADVVGYFTHPNLDFKYDGTENPAEFVLDIASRKVAPMNSPLHLTAEQLEALYIQSDINLSQNCFNQSQRKLVFPVIERVNQTLHATTKRTQFLMLMHRSFLSIIRDTEALQAEFLKNVIVGILIAVIFFGQARASSPLYSNGVPNAEVSNISSLLFFGMMYTSIATAQAIPFLCSRHLIFRREISSFTYSASPYWLCQCIINLPFLAFYHFLFLTVFYFPCNFPLDIYYYIYIYLVLFLNTIISFYSAMILAAVTNGNKELALALFPLSFIVLTNFAGFSIPIDNLPIFWQWASYVSYLRWVFAGLMVNQWESFDTDDTTYAVYGNGNVLALYGFEGFNKFDSYWILSIYIVVTALLLYFLLRPPSNHLKQIAQDPPEVLHSSDIKMSQRISESAEELLGSVLHSKDSLIENQLYNDIYTVEDGAICDDVIVVENNIAVNTNISLLMEASEAAHCHSCRLEFRDVTYSIQLVNNKESVFKKLTRYSQWNKTYTPVDYERLNTIVSESISQLHSSEATDDTESTSSSKSITPKKVILSNVFGMVKPGEMCALMGASGAGKTTLLDILAGRKTKGEIGGTLLFDGEPRSDAIMRSAAYVMQDNVHYSVLTVYETLMFAAKLRLSTSTTTKQRKDRVNLILSVFGLHGVKNTPVGSAGIRGISGGQLKRLSIGVEIVGLPAIIFLDEPTTGLDSTLSHEVMYAVKNLSRAQRTVICTIHQPSPATFELFDTLLLLAEGRVIYFGDAKKCENYFWSSPFRFKNERFANPADFIIAVAGGFVEPSATDSNVKKPSSIQMAVFFESTSGYAELLKEFESTEPMRRKNHHENKSTHSHFGYLTSTYNQITVLSERVLLVKVKDPGPLIGDIFRHAVVSLFYGSIYYQLQGGTDPTAYTERLGLLFFSILFMVMGHQAAIPKLLEDRLLFYRERGAFVYGAFAYWVSGWIVTIPLALLNTFMYCTILYYMVGFNSSPGAFLFYCLTMLITTINGLFIAQSIAAISPSIESATSLFPISVFFSISFAGYIVFIPKFPDWLGTWAPYISFIRYAFEAFVLNEFEGNNDVLPLEANYIELLGFNNFDKWLCIPIISLFAVGNALFVLLVLSYVNFEKR